MTPFSPQTQNLSFGHLWIDERKAALPKDRNRHFEGCGKLGVWWQHEKYSVWKHVFSTNILYMKTEWFILWQHRKPRKTRSNNKCLDDGTNYYCMYVLVLHEWGRGWAGVVRMPYHRTMACLRVAWQAGQWQRCGAHCNWICQNSPPVNVVPLLGKAAAHDLLLSRRDRWLYLLFCCCCCGCLCRLWCWRRQWWWCGA